MTRKHQSGPNSARPGEWVKCPAQQQCRNNSLHINSELLYPVRKMYETETGIKVSRVSELPLEAVEKYIRSSNEVKTKTVDALMVDVRHRNELALKRNPNLVVTEEGYESLKQTYLSSHLPPKMAEKSTPVVKKEPVLTPSNVSSIAKMLKAVEIKDKDTRIRALTSAYMEMDNLTEEQRDAILWGINDMEASMTRQAGLIQSQRGLVASATFLSILKLKNDGRMQAANDALNILVNSNKRNKENDKRWVEEDKKMKEARTPKEAVTTAKKSFGSKFKALFSKA